MKYIREDIGKRLRLIREGIIGEGIELSASQFAKLFNSTRDKIINYESGRSNLPVEILVKLYNRGVNPIYVLTGEGSIFAPNEAGSALADRLRENGAYRAESEPASIEPTKFDPSKLSEEDKISLISAAAGDILKKRKGGK